MESELRENIKNFLLNHDLCSMCIQRYLGEKLQRTYCKIFEEWQSNPQEPQSKRIQRSVCPICLGILEPSFLFETFESVLKTTSASKCMHDNFLMSIAVPPVILLRHHHVVLLMKKNLKYSPHDLMTVKDCAKFVLGSLFEQAVESIYSPTSSFQINIQVKGSLEPSEMTAVNRLSAPTKKIIHKKAKSSDEFSIKSITSFLEEVEDDEFLREFQELPKCLRSTPESAIIGCGHQQIYLAGRYCKYSRELSQTPWIIDGERKMKDSVEELITRIVRQFVVCEKITFSSSGREDVDVRMLGDGRPFVLEVWGPRKISWSFREMDEIQSAINKSTEDISVNRFQLISREATKDLKTGEENKKKMYCAYCVSEESTSKIDFSRLTAISDLELKQRTPMRVLHRRSAMTRSRTIHEVSVEIQDDHHFKLELCTQAGTYVKEFVHGDLGRTLPNVRDIVGANIDIKALDVVRVDLDWPPEVPVAV